MPELPDLIYIKKYLDREIRGRTIVTVAVKQPVIIRAMIDRPIQDALAGSVIEEIEQHGPFLRVGLSEGLDVVINLMLAGRLQHQRDRMNPEGYLCFSWVLDDGTAMNLCDEKKMAKIYVLRHGAASTIPKYGAQGIDILSPGFTREHFRKIAAAHPRKQVRVVINDHSLLSAIGNAYADEILFEAGIHPKTFMTRLTPGDVDRLYDAIREVIGWGIRKVEEAGQPIHVKVRDHMKVRNRKGEPCPRCGTTIRREGVRGHDVFFCPRCQPASRKSFIDWRGAPETSPRSKSR